MSSDGSTAGERALFGNRSDAMRAALWLGAHPCWVALDAGGQAIGAVDSPQPGRPLRIWAYGHRPTWRSQTKRPQFYAADREVWSIDEVFQPGLFPTGNVVRLVDPTSRRTLAQAPTTRPAAPVPAPPATPRPVSISLTDAVALFASIKQAYAGYELDARKLLAFPALVDPYDPVSAAWFQAFADARALEPEDPARCPPVHAQRFIAAAEAAEKAWEAAEANARTIALDRLDSAQRNRLRKARQALDIALDPGASAGERQAAVAATLDLLDGIVTLPATTQAKLFAAITAAPERPQLG